MFDYVRSSYPLPDAFMGENQTKDLQLFGGTMTHYWIDPKGVLWEPDYTGTRDYVKIGEEDPRYNSNLQFFNHEWVSTGIHGRLQPHDHTGYVTIYPSRWDAAWEDWPRCRLHFRHGVMQDYEEVTGQ